jgi:hypothetical protein
MITVRIENTPKAITQFQTAMRRIGACVDMEDSDPENVWYNVTADDDDKLERAIEKVTSAYTRY